MQKTLAAFSVFMVVAIIGVATYFSFKRSQKHDEEVWGVPWAPYTPSVGHYTMSFPHRPHETTTPVMQSQPVTHITQYTFVHDDDADEEWRVELTQLPHVTDLEKELDKGVDDARHTGWTEIARSKITLNGTKHPGRAATFKETNSRHNVTTQMREYIVDDWLYVLLCTGVKNEADITKFFDSFKLAK
jgi:hypothetical protein